MALSSMASRSGNITIRQLKWLVGILLLSNILLGAFSVYALHHVDRRYSELIARSVPVLNDLQTLTGRAAQAMVATSPSKLQSMSVGAFLQDATTALQLEASDRAAVLKDVWLIEPKAERQDMETAAQEFSITANAVLSLIKKGQVPDAVRKRDAELRPAFDRYIIAITKAADVLEVEGRNANDSETERTESVSHVVLGFAAWPLIFALSALIFGIAFVMTLMMVFRVRSAGGGGQ